MLCARGCADEDDGCRMFIIGKVVERGWLHDIVLGRRSPKTVPSSCRMS
jgi:hypothetical protein